MQHAVPFKIAEFLTANIERDLAMPGDVAGQPSQGAIIGLPKDWAPIGAAAIVEGFIVREKCGITGKEPVAAWAGVAEEGDVDRPFQKWPLWIGLILRRLRQHAEQWMLLIPFGHPMWLASPSG